MTPSSDALLFLIRLALGKGHSVSLPNAVSWQEVYELSLNQGVCALCGGVVAQQGETLNVEEDLRYVWLGQKMVQEKEYELYRAAVRHLSDFYAKQGIRMVLLKGLGLSFDYPNPTLRPCGDIDVYLMSGGKGVWNYGDKLIEEKLGIKVDNSHHHHSVFLFEGWTVENHYDFINVHSHRSNKRIDSLFKALMTTGDVTDVTDKETTIGIPSPDFNALFLARHAAIHFAAERLTLRHLLDWALFVSNHHRRVDWDNFWREAEKMNMHKFVLCVNAIAVQDLGFDEADFHIPSKYGLFPEKHQTLMNQVRNDIWHPRINDLTKGLGRLYVVGRLKLWWANRWKHRIVYSDTLVGTFFVQIGSHLMKPSTLRRSAV